ncbi:protein of unknown function [Clostridium collagenovorans DSM 3089]|uniref:DUF4352 domain-containing protein n=1 Tax=Clostridium collagenovorans DSM 3089 TaxID=1121306 RepID=A0A1M5X6R3_9CLOT|nr:DUF4352 domain-containing protein [Clostridium collagenovorans]SHH95530.1 protein of unknown function [Clostridium collagenovorans DSM 3089]
MRNKRIVIVSFILIIIAIFIGYRYYKINDGIVKEYDVKGYSTGEVIKLDDIEITAKGISSESEGDSEIIYTIDLTVENTSNKEVDIKPFYYKSKLVTNNIILDVPVGRNKEQKEDLLKQKEERDIQIKYSIPKAYKNEYFELYFPKEMYSKEIEEVFKEMKMHEKYVALSLKK